MTQPQPARNRGGVDALLPFLFEDAPVRGALVRLEGTSRAILACHDYPAPLASALSELLAASALLASTLKLDGSLVVQLSGDGPVRLLVVDCNGALDVRATAQWDDAAVAALGARASLASLAGGARHGRLALTLDQRGAGTLYQGIVSLDTTSIAASIEHYLATSEQLPSRLWLLPEGDGVTGLLLQRLPGAEDGDAPAWPRLVASADRALAAAARERAVPRALSRLFPHDDVRVFRARPVQFRCRCSSGRVANALRIAGRAEIEAALEERGIVEVTCEFCGRRYTFTPAQARALFTNPPSSRIALQ
ncbi:MAG: Hsp33 family molecular chaperone HslO [Rudaea sp.]